MQRSLGFRTHVWCAEKGYSLIHPPTSHASRTNLSRFFCSTTFWSAGLIESVGAQHNNFPAKNGPRAHSTQNETSSLAQETSSRILNYSDSIHHCIRVSHSSSLHWLCLAEISPLSYHVFHVLSVFWFWLLSPLWATGSGSLRRISSHICKPSNHSMPFQ